MKLKFILPLALIFASLIVSFYLYPHLPNSIATHWGLDNQPNGFSSKIFGVFLLPIVSLFSYIIFLVLPNFDPYRQNFNQFKHHFYVFVNVLLGFFLCLHLAILIWNLGYHFDLVQVISPLFGIIFYYAGILIGVSKRNWFVGIRTPWTLSSDFVWQKTHFLGAKLFKISGLICFLALFLPRLAILFILVPPILSTVVVFVYSYLLFRDHS